MDIAPQIQPILVAQGPVNVPVAVNLPMLDGDNNNNNNNNDSSVGETDNIMTDSVIAPPSFSGKAAQDPSDWIRHFIIDDCIVSIRHIPLRGRRPSSRYY